MAKPELENGFTRIANEILEAIGKTKLNGHEFRILIILFRQTYGYGKKNDKISAAQWEEFTGINRRKIWEAIDGLKKKNIIIIDNNHNTNIYSFQKNYEEWISDKHVPKTSLVTKTAPAEKGTKTCAEIGNEHVPKSVITKETYKENKEIKDSDTIEKKSPTESQLMFEALADVCYINWKTCSSRARGELNKVGKVFRDANYKPSDIKAMGEWWFKYDWRAKTGQPPTPNQLRDEIGTWEAFKSGKIKMEPNNGNRRQTADPGLERLRKRDEDYHIADPSQSLGITAADDSI
jgi:phage replication O-like protein O